MVLKEEKVFVTSGEKKSQCSKGDQCSFRHESNDRATRGWSVSRKRNARARSQSVKFSRPPCKYFLKGTCTKSPCEYWHRPECQFQKNESGFKAGDKCLFPHHKVDEQPNRKPKKSDHSQKRRENDDKNAVAIVKIVSQMGCVSQDSELLDSQRGKQAREKSWDPFEEYDSLSLRYVKQVSGEERTIAWKNTSQKSSPAKSDLQEGLQVRR